MSTKVTLKLAGKAEELFNELCNRMDEPDTEVVVDALALYHFVTGQMLAGNVAGFMNPTTNDFQEVSTPMLSKLKNRG